MTYTLFLILILIVAVLLVLIIMVQNPKGGGLSSSFGGAGGSQSMGGVQSTNNFLDKSTWTLAIALMAMILLSNFAIPRENTNSTDSQIEETLNNRITEDEAPSLPEVEETEEAAE